FRAQDCTEHFFRITYVAITADRHRTGTKSSNGKQGPSTPLRNLPGPRLPARKVPFAARTKTAGGSRAAARRKPWDDRPSSAVGQDVTGLSTILAHQFRCHEPHVAEHSSDGHRQHRHRDEA